MIAFGKHNNKSYSYVLENDMDYCLWCLDQTESSNEGMINFANFLKQQKIIKEIIEKKHGKKYCKTRCRTILHLFIGTYAEKYRFREFIE